MDRFDGQPDDELLLRARGEPEAFAALYRRFESPVLLFFLRRVHSAEVAADLAAETFAQALASRRRFRPDRGTAGAWLFGIAGHVLARSMERGRVEGRARRRLKLPPLVLADEALEAIDALISPADGSVIDLLARLPHDQRTAVQARVVEDRSYGEIAAQLRCSEHVVRKRVSRGLAAMRAQIEEAR